VARSALLLLQQRWRWFGGTFSFALPVADAGRRCKKLNKIKIDSDKNVDTVFRENASQLLPSIRRITSSEPPFATVIL
jgi:hypothetical protein